MLCGDLDNDGTIGAKDLAIMLSGANYLRGADTAANPLADLDGDGSIGAKDLAILLSASNYMKGEVVIN